VRPRTRATRGLWYAAFVPDDYALAPGGALPPAAPLLRPNAPRRLAAGAWHVLAGFGFLLRRLTTGVVRV